MRAIVRYIFDRLPYIGSLRRKIRDQGAYPAGHYYSPIPKPEEVLKYLESTKKDKSELPDIHLNREGQAERLNAFETFYHDLPFPEEKGPN